jgi:DNA-binding CsgD family transcriptional regulator
LTDGQLRKIRELQELLVTPLRFPTSKAWSEAVQQVATDLFSVERSLVVLPVVSGKLLVHSLNLGADTQEGLEKALVGTGPEVNRYYDPLLNRAMGRLAAAGVEVWNREIAGRISRVKLEEMPRFYPEVVDPGRLEGMLAMGHSLPEGRAMLQVLPDSGESTAFGSDAVDVFRLLLPAFKAGCRAHALTTRRRDRLRASLDLLEEGTAVYRAGAERYRNRALDQLLAAEEREGELLAAMARCSEQLVQSLQAPGVIEGPQVASTEVTTPTNRYRIAASHLEGGSAGRPTTVLVVVRPAVPPLPDQELLQERYGLTARQAEVAVLLARGGSNREIAERLVISPHTARHHAQRVLEKVGAKSRKALALHLLADQR